MIENGIPNIITEYFTKEGSHFNIWGGLNNEEKLLHRYLSRYGFTSIMY